jgi:hypothetical protein
LYKPVLAELHWAFNFSALSSQNPPAPEDGTTPASLKKLSRKFLSSSVHLRLERLGSCVIENNYFLNILFVFFLQISKLFSTVV